MPEAYNDVFADIENGLSFQRKGGILADDLRGSRSDLTMCEMLGRIINEST